MKKFTTFIFLVICLLFLMLAVGGEKSIAVRFCYFLLAVLSLFSACLIHYKIGLR